jgi:ABC-type sugar transport system ATPase subunit
VVTNLRRGYVGFVSEFETSSVQATSGSTEAMRLELRSLDRRFGAIPAVAGFSLALAPGEIHGLCGHNGAGKSTVVKMVCGLLQPDAGEVLIDGESVQLSSPQAAQRCGIAHVHQELSVISTLKVSENLMLGRFDEALWLRRRAIKDRSAELLTFVGLPTNLVDTTVGDLNIGQRQLVEIARSMGRGARVLLLDEPTATLSKNEIDLVFRAIRKVADQGCSVIFVSHRLGEVIELCDRVTVMRDGVAVSTMTTDGLVPDEIISHMLGSLPDAAVRAPVLEQEVCLSTLNLSVPGMFGPVSLDVRPGRIYALAGQIGSGASEVLRALAGLYPATTGRVTVDHRPLALGRPILTRRRGVAFVSGDRKSEGLFLQRNVEVNLLASRLSSVSRAGIVLGRLKRALARQLATAAGVATDRLATRVVDLSGGNQQKVFVGRNLDDPEIRVLLLDEPTRGVDVAGRRAIHDLLRAAAERGVAVVFASTELDELVELADTVITMREGLVVSTLQSPVNPATVLADMTYAA